MDLTRRTLVKVPEITALFWITKLLTTAMGESTSDYLVNAVDPVLAVAVGTLVLLGVLAFQIGRDRYIPWVYWLAVLLVAIVGTMAADVLHKQFGVPYAASSVFFAIVLAVTFVVWDRVEGTLSIHSVDSVRREVLYWVAVMATFAMGTALGDYTASTLHLGYLASACFFAGLILIPAIGYRWFRMNEVVAFWFAYIVTRPLGASIADWLGKPGYRSGIGWGDGPVSLALAVLIVACVAAMTRTWRRTTSTAERPGGGNGHADR
jgi:uncharacterized membrane-anchored protein